MSWKHIICAVDFSEASRTALRVAAEESAESGADLVLVYAWVPPVYFVGEMIGLPAGVIADMVGTAERELEAWKTEAIGFGAKKVRAELLHGAPWHEIVQLAKREGADLIVLGTHGRTGIKHALIGSVAEKVVRHSPCAALVVPPKH
jgi:nucleotide-binding universal stress UspA family protein